MWTNNKSWPRIVVFSALGLLACGRSDAPASRLVETIGGGSSYDVVAEYPHEGRSWKVIIVDQGLSDDELAELGTELRVAFPENFIQLVDDLSKVEAFVDWRRNFPSEEFRKPALWINTHHLATIRRVYEGGKREWQLLGGPAHPALAGKKIRAYGRSPDNEKRINLDLGNDRPGQS